MRSHLHASIVGLAVLLIAETPALAQERPGATDFAEKTKRALDTLFKELLEAKTHEAAKRVEGMIWRTWLQSGNEAVDTLMTKARLAMQNRRYPVALTHLNEIVALAPDYAEGWNKRATLYFLMSDYGKSISDIERVLALEPRHFGALSGLGMIMRILDEQERALFAYRRLKEIYPLQRGLRRTLQELEDELGRKV